LDKKMIAIHRPVRAHAVELITDKRRGARIATHPQDALCARVQRSMPAKPVLARVHRASKVQICDRM
jgi:hypothetical protein